MSSEQQTLELELRFEESLVEVFEKGTASGVFQCKNAEAFGFSGDGST